MPRSNQYYTLIGSLPALPRHFAQAERVPISPRQLDQRLRMLSPEDAQVVESLRDFLIWERQPLERTDDDVVLHYARVTKTVPNEFARALMHRAISVRTIVAGLRCRRLGLDAPPGDTSVATQIQRNWNHPDFRLGHHFPWIVDVDRTLNSSTPYEVERQRLEIAWKFESSMANQYFFSFEAVLLYLVRWEVVFRWTQRDSEAGRTKFEQLVTESMGEYAAIYAE